MRRSYDGRMVDGYERMPEGEISVAIGPIVTAIGEKDWAMVQALSDVEDFLALRADLDVLPRFADHRRGDIEIRRLTSRDVDGREHAEFAVALPPRAQAQLHIRVRGELETRVALRVSARIVGLAEVDGTEPLVDAGAAWSPPPRPPVDQSMMTAIEGMLFRSEEPEPRLPEAWLPQLVEIAGLVVERRWDVLLERDLADVEALARVESWINEFDLDLTMEDEEPEQKPQIYGDEESGYEVDFPILDASTGEYACLHVDVRDDGATMRIYNMKNF